MVIRGYGLHLGPAGTDYIYNTISRRKPNSLKQLAAATRCRVQNFNRRFGPRPVAKSMV